MELLFVMLGGVILGLIARYVLPKRDLHGSMLVPAIGGIVSAVIWVALTWLGFAWDGGVIWWLSLGGTAIVVLVADLVLGRLRTASDGRLRVQLGL
ncbi:hypothetical protein GCM10027416_12140 [Okibacterium endophyticum]